MEAYLFGALISGLIIGAIPAITGGVKGKLKLGIGGFAACVIGSIILGMLLSIPLCALFMFLIFKKDDKNKVTQAAHAPAGETASNTGYNDVAEKINKLSALKDSGALTEEEFQQKKEELLSKI